jgi:hypothetical protein
MEKIVLNILSLFKWLFPLIDVDFEKMKAILRAKLISDNRRPFQSFDTSASAKKMSNTFLKSMLFYVIFGIFPGVSIMFLPLFLSMVMIHSFIMFMMGSALIINFSSVLLDTTDNAILIPRPVDSRTILMARMIHIAVYLFTIALSLALASIVFGTIKFGIVFLPAFLFTLVSSTLITVFFINLMYLVIIHFTSGEKFRDIILYFQIIIGVIFMGGMQIIPRITDRFDFENLNIALGTWSYFVPPAWLAGTMEAIVSDIFQTPYIQLILLTVVVPAVGIYIVAKFLGPGFSRKLALMESSSGKIQEPKKDKKPKVKWMLLFSQLFTRSGAEKAAFEMAWKISSRDRKFKLKTYPGFGYIIIFFYIFVLKDYSSIQDVLTSLPETKKYIVLLYICFFEISIFVPHLALSDNHKASWIYRFLPVKKPGEIMSGALKSVMVKYISLIFVLVTVFILALWGVETVPDIFFGFLSMIIFSFLSAIILKRVLPFSKALDAVQVAGDKGKAMAIMFMAPVFGGIHYGLTYVNYAVIALIPVLVAAVYFLERKYRNTPWDVVDY